MLPTETDCADRIRQFLYFIDLEPWKCRSSNPGQHFSNEDRLLVEAASVFCESRYVIVLVKRFWVRNDQTTFSKTSRMQIGNASCNFRKR